jgi:hypothetical protein
MRKTIIVTLILGVALSACQFNLSAAPAIPTISLVEMQATANAIAQVAIAQTMAAMPTATATATPLPPTPTPVLEPATPTEVLVLPSPTAAPTKASGTDPCSYTSLSTVKGPHVDVVINARLEGGTMQLRYFLRETPFGCGYGVTMLSDKNSTTINIPQGCYDIYGMYSGKKNDHFYTYACFEKKTYYALLYPEMIHFSTTP